jgi:3-phosphoshikimate 1-carboxyvinyltransferase
MTDRLQGPFRARPSQPLQGQFQAPGDKSISHRAFMFAALAQGESLIDAALESDDVLNTAKAMAAVGADVERTGPGAWRVAGLGGRFESPAEDLDFGNSGTGVRLVMGLLAGTGIKARFVGDASLSSRPMKRVTDPLSQMGAKLVTQDGRLPVDMQPARLTGIDYTPPMASAQVKSAVLLAGLTAQGVTVVREPVPTRDHTETMLKLFGGEITVALDGEGRRITLPGSQRLDRAHIRVPGDPSSAAFAVVAALITPGSEVTITGVMDNPARSGLYRTLQDMQADLDIRPGPDMAGERTIDITARYSALKAIEVPAERAPSMIDEYPILSVAAAFADGTTRMQGLDELRAKESDRLAATAALLTANGVTVAIEGDTLAVTGAAEVPGGGRVETLHDHRIAMSGLVLGLAAQNPVEVDDTSMIATSYPDFLDHMAALGAKLEPVR